MEEMISVEIASFLGVVVRSAVDDDDNASDVIELESSMVLLLFTLSESTLWVVDDSSLMNFLCFLCNCMG